MLVRRQRAGVTLHADVAWHAGVALRIMLSPHGEESQAHRGGTTTQRDLEMECTEWESASF